MQLIRGLHNLDNQPECVVTIGNFDGIHIGHQEIISKLVSTAQKKGIPSMVISFSVTPESFFGRPKARLSSFRDKHLFLKSMGINKHLLIKFNKSFSEISASSFIEDILVKKINVKHCYIGDDFRFGKNRTGDFSLLEKYAVNYKFVIEKVDGVYIDDQRVSSSAIRELLSTGSFEMSKKLLGRAFSISGQVAHGDKQGRTIGFPTANIPIRRQLSPVLGVFCVVVRKDNKNFNGVCNVGKRPTRGETKVLLEVYILDFNQEIYGEYVEVIFKKKIRDEIKFSSFEELKSQIKKDTQSALQYFSSSS